MPSHVNKKSMQAGPFVAKRQQGDSVKKGAVVINLNPETFDDTQDLPVFNADEVFARARNAFASGKTKDVFFRKSQLKSLDKMLVENQKVLIEAVHKDLRKPAFEVIAAEIDVIRNEIRSILISIDRLVKPETVPMTIATSLDNTVIVYEPFGSVFIIGAWNYPLQLTLAPLVGAISAGNCAVVKPSEISVVTSRVIAELLPQYLDRDCYQVVEGGAAETTQLLQQKWDYIFYTGSPRVGKIVYEAAAKNLVPVTLELGGKSPCWFDDSITDFETALKRVVWGKLLNCGQTCVAPDYLICTKAVQDKVVQAIPGILKNFYGESIAASSDYPRIVTENHFNRLVKMIESTKGKIVIGGTFNREDKFIAPTVVTDVPLDDVLMSEELFGPILPIVTVNSETEAIDFIKKGEKPLAMYIFTNKESVKQRFIKETSAGSMAINDTILQLTVEGFPFGGVGNSGIGFYHGKFSFYGMSHPKPILLRNYNPLAEVIAKNRYPPYNDTKLMILKNLLQVRDLHMEKLPYFVVFVAGVAVTLAWNMFM